MSVRKMEQNIPTGLRPLPNNLVQNFFIVASPADVAAGAQAQTVIRAIQEALSGVSAPEMLPVAKRAPLEDVAREWYQNRVASWALCRAAEEQA